MAGRPLSALMGSHGPWLILALLQGCSADPVIVYRPVEVKIPVPVRAEPPPALVKPYQPSSLPRFISPQDPAARSALSDADLNHLKALLRTLKTRDDAWRAWAVQPPQGADK